MPLAGWADQRVPASIGNHLGQPEPSEDVAEAILLEVMAAEVLVVPMEPPTREAGAAGKVGMVARVS